MSRYPPKVALIKAEIPCPLGHIYTAQDLERAAANDERMSFSDDTLWYHNIQNPQETDKYLDDSQEPDPMAELDKLTDEPEDNGPDAGGSIRA